MSTGLSEAERFARVRLARTDKVGPVTFRQLLDRFGSAERAVEALPDLNHFTVLDPLFDAESTLVRRLADLAHRR